MWADTSPPAELLANDAIVVEERLELFWPIFHGHFEDGQRSVRVSEGRLVLLLVDQEKRAVAVCPGERLPCLRTGGGFEDGDCAVTRQFGVGPALLEPAHGR